MSAPLWAPTKERIEKTLLSHFMHQVEAQQQKTFADYDDLWCWSVDELEAFWGTFWQFSGIKGERGGQVLRNKQDLFHCEFFPGAQLNYAENLLQNMAGEPAIIFRHESGRRRE